jgi:hypothetical protein
MGNILPAFPDAPAHTITIDLDGAQYVVRYTWRERSASWYLDLSTVDGTALITGRRLSAGWVPTLGLVIDGLPSGVLFVRGVDGYERDDLGTDLLVVHYTDDEIASAAGDAADDVTITDGAAAAPTEYATLSAAIKAVTTSSVSGPRFLVCGGEEVTIDGLGNVSTWGDKSTAGSHDLTDLVGTAPLYEGSGRWVRFAGGGLRSAGADYIDAGDMTALVVFQYPEIEIRTTAVVEEDLFEMDYAAGFWFGRPVGSEDEMIVGVQNTSPPFGEVIACDEQPTALISRVKSAGIGYTLEVFKNGAVASTAVLPSRPAFTEKYAVGMSNAGTFPVADCKIACAAVWDRDLSDLEVRELTKVLRAFGLIA